MTSEVVNLRRFRKRKLREAAAEQAGQNRVLHGRTSQEKALASLERERADARFAGHRRVAAERPGDADAALPKPDGDSC